MGSQGRARWMILGAALLFSTGGAAVKMASVTGWSVAGWRSAFAAIALFVVMPAARKGWSWRTGFVAIWYALTLVLFVLANKLTTAVNSIFLQSTAPLYVLVLSPWLLKEKWSKRDLLVIGLIALGLGCLVGSEDAVSTVASNPPLGNALAAASGVTWAGTILGLRWLGQRPGPEQPITAAALGNVLAAAIALPFADAASSFVWMDWTILLYLGIFQIGAAYVLMTSAVKVLPALQVSLLLMLEPVASGMFAWLVHGEVPGPMAGVGALFIMGAMAVQLVDTRTGE